MSKKSLVAYFSASGITAEVAKKMAEGIGADLYEIKPAIPYTQADLDWHDETSRSSVEMKDPHSRPELADQNAPILDCEVIYLGFPIWWYVAPTIINTFLESYDFAGKKIVIFATSGSSSLGNTKAALEGSCPGAQMVEGTILRREMTSEALKKWAEQI